MKIVFDALEADAKRYFVEKLEGHELIFLPEVSIATLENCSDADILSIFVSTKVEKAHLEALPSLKMIATRSTGFDHIDAESVRARALTLSNVPVYGARTVAEYAFALILALTRKAYAAYDRLRRDGTTDVKDFEGFDLNGKTLGIIGTGHIGKNAARIARGFAMDVLAYDVRPDEVAAREIGYTYVPLDELVEKCDIVSLHVPYMPATHHLVDETLLSKFKPGSILINTARGGIVDTTALVRALKEKRLAGAGLDVLEGERSLFDELSLLTSEHHDIKEFQALVAAHVLLDTQNVVVTPHIAFNTIEAKREINETTAQNILSFVKGAPQNVVKL